MKDIKVLLFDLGGVIIDIDPSITINALKSMSKKSSEDFNALNYKYYKEESSLLNFFFEYEKGNINDDKFRNGIRKFANLDLSNNKIDHIWNYVIVKINKDLLDVVLSLKNRYKIMILSNTNFIHKLYYDKLVVDIYGKNLKQLFDKVFYSFEIRSRKPELEIYQRVIDESSYSGKEILFFDDMKENLEIPKVIGMKTYHVEDITLTKQFLKKI